MVIVSGGGGGGGEWGGGVPCLMLAVYWAAGAVTDLSLLYSAS